VFRLAIDMKQTFSHPRNQKDPEASTNKWEEKKLTLHNNAIQKIN
jgi:hypothetical protein